jgi:hemerythrin superfamily protein
MNAIELLKKQHRDVEAMFDRLGVPGDPADDLEDEEVVAVAAFQHADGHTETTEEADSRFRDEGGGSAMDVSASEYRGTTKGRDKPTQGVGMASAPVKVGDGEVGRASTLLNTGRARAEEQPQRSDYEDDPRDVTLDPHDDRLAASWQDVPMAHGSKLEALTARSAGLHDSPNLGSASEHAGHGQSRDDADQHDQDDRGMRDGKSRTVESAHASPRPVDDSAGRRASPASRQNLSDRRPFGDDRQALFDQLASALIAHATVEEQIFYPAARSDQTDDLLYEAIEEHASVRRLIEELRRMRHSDVGFGDKLALLREKVDNHVHDEETELFPNVIEELGVERLMELGRLIDSRYRTLTGAGAAQGRPVSAEEPVTVEPVARTPQHGRAR